MSLFHSKPDRRTNEGVFFAYYSRLLEWALQITRNDRSEAEDLVHDFYLRLTRITKSIDEMEQLEHYLFKVLRNLYFSRLRRAGRVPLNDLTIVDYDSVEQGLAVADRRELLFARTHLRQICSHACQRKSTARSASILILRFFHGYYPIEVMKILKASRFSVDRSLQVARNEARLYLERPDVLRSISPSTKPPVSFSMTGEDTQQLFWELQEAIFSAAEGECIDAVALAQRYLPESEASGITTQELSHLVSCGVCLDRVNTILHLPLLADRSPEDSIDRDNSSGPGADGGSQVTPIRKKVLKKGPSIRKLERRARELFEHRPGSIEIVVDGDVRSSQKITAEINEFRLKLTRKEEPSFIEVLSEQGLCLAFLQVAEPVSADKLEQVENALFSDDRSLVLTLSFDADGPIIHVLYRDPVMAEATAGDSIAKPVLGNAYTGNTLFAPIIPSKLIFVGPHNRFGRWAGQLTAWLAGHSKDLLVLVRNPLLVGGAATAIVVCLWVWPHKTPPMSAIALLQHAEVSEAVPFSVAKPEIVYEKVRIQTAKGSIERSIYRDTSGRRKQKQQPVDPQTAALETKLTSAGVNWNEPLSAATYQDWRDHVQVTADAVQEAGQNLLTLTTTVSNAEITQESLTVRESDFHPVARTISFRDTGTVEIAELDYQVLPWNAGSETWFKPAALSSSNVAPLHPSLRLPALEMLSESQLDEAELSVRLALTRLHADTGEQIEVAREPRGIEVRGITDTTERKRELEAQLRMLPHVTVSISSIEELKAKPSRLDELSSAKVVEMQAQTTPLESYYLAHGRNVALLNRLSPQLLNSADVISFECRTIDDLQRRFAHDGHMSAIASATLTDLLFTHKHKLLAALADQEQLLTDAQIEAPRVKRVASTNVTDSALADLAEQNLVLARELAVGKGASSRPAETIASELTVSIDELNLRAHAMQVVPQNSTNLAKRK